MGISVWQLLVVLVILIVLFGSKRIRNLGADLGKVIKGFRNAIDESEAEVKTIKTGNAPDVDVERGDPSSQEDQQRGKSKD